MHKSFKALIRRLQVHNVVTEEKNSVSLLFDPLWEYTTEPQFHIHNYDFANTVIVLLLGKCRHLALPSLGVTV